MSIKTEMSKTLMTIAMASSLCGDLPFKSDLFPKINKGEKTEKYNKKKIKKKIYYIDEKGNPRTKSIWVERKGDENGNL